MSSTSTDRLAGLTTSVAVKAPCRLKTTANHALTGLAAIDGVTPVAGDRILVGSNTLPAENGIYVASASSSGWVRALDFNGSLDAVGGTRVLVNEGSTFGGSYWRVSGDGPVVIGTDAIVFAGGDGIMAATVGTTDGGTVQSELDELIPDKVLRVTSQNLPSFVTTALPGIVVGNANYAGIGGAEHNVDLFNSFLSLYGGQGATVGNDLIDRYVSWTTGDDATGTGRGDAPYKTIKKAQQAHVDLGQIWLMGDSEEVLDIEGTDQTVAGGTLARAIVVRPLQGRVTFRSPGEDPTTGTWAETAPGSTIWRLTNTAAKRAEAIIYAPDGDVKNGFVVPCKGLGSSDADAAAKAGATFNGWCQNGATGDICLRFLRDMDIDANKTQFFIIYSATSHTLKGATLYFEDCDLIGGAGFKTPNSTVTSTFHSRLFMKNCAVHYMADKGFEPAGNSKIYLQGCTVTRNSGDGVGPYGSAVAGVIDCDLSDNGIFETYGTVNNPARNRQGLSTHETSQAFAIGCRIVNNYGQNVANTTDNAAMVTTYLFACDCRHPALVYPFAGGAIVGFTCIETYGVAYVGECLAGGPSAIYGWVVGSGQGYGYRNRLSGTTSGGSGTAVGGVLEYDPYAALPV